MKLRYYMGITIGACAIGSLALPRKMPSSEGMVALFRKHRMVFDEIIKRLRDDGDLEDSHFTGTYMTSLLDPWNSGNARSLPLRPGDSQFYKSAFGEIGVSEPATVYSRNGAALFTLGTTGIAIGGGGAMRGIAYVDDPEHTLGFHLVLTSREAEESDYGGVLLVPLEAHWYLYYINPS